MVERWNIGYEKRMVSWFLPYMKLHGMTNDELWMSLRSAFLTNKIERIP
jgi:hypothetical protein